MRRVILPARVSHHSVPLLGTSSAVAGSCDRHCFYEAVAHWQHCFYEAVAHWQHCFYEAVAHRRLFLPSGEKCGAWVTLLAWAALAVLPGTSAMAEGEPPARQDVLVAAVGHDPIYARHVDRALEQITGGGQVNPAVLPAVKARVLAEIIDRRLVLAYARRTGTGAKPEQVDAALAALSAQLAAEKRSLAGELAKRGITEADLRRQLAWNLTWPKYLARYATKPRLEQHFAAHRPQFDGTEVSVSHVLLAPPPDAAAGAIDELVGRAEAIRRQIDSGELDFEEAARRYSSAPSREQGGRLGFITRHGSMVESFSRTAFSLSPGQVSRPVTTRFGVHLIRVDEIKPGKKQLADVAEQVEDSLARELVRKLAQHERAHTPVRFTGRGPYFEPGSGELIVP